MHSHWEKLLISIIYLKNIKIFLGYFQILTLFIKQKANNWIKKRISPLILIIMFMISVIIYKYEKQFQRGFYFSNKTIQKPFHPIIIPMNYLLLLSEFIPTFSISH
jgi:MFS superfamily sulfate permease-like transporter